MQNPNEKTIQTYETYVQEYLNGAPRALSMIVKEWLDEAVAGLPKGSRILELGSGSGRDAKYLQKQGYKVECTDATQAFVDLLNKEGLQARKLNAITDELGGPYDMVLADAVLLHFTRDETKHVLKKIYSALKDGNVFALTLQQGEGEKWQYRLGREAPRYFCFWTKAQIHKLFKEIGFKHTKITVDGTTNGKWLQIIAKK